MCVAVVAFDYVREFPLVIVSNRDEFHGRDTARAHFWEDEPSILAGRDLEKGGTWLGSTTSGRVALVTNYRELDNREYDRSRGHLVSEFLRASISASDYAKEVRSSGDEYAGFNLILFDGIELAYVSNRAPTVKLPGSGVYGLSNHLLETPWPKVQRSKTAVIDILNNGDPMPGVFIDAMYEQVVATDDRLPRTGVPFERERALSPVFISGDRYGTRCTTVVTVGNGGHISLTEQTYRPNGIPAGRNTFIHHGS